MDFEWKRKRSLRREKLKWARPADTPYLGWRRSGTLRGRPAARWEELRQEVTATLKSLRWGEGEVGASGHRVLTVTVKGMQVSRDSTGETEEGFGLVGDGE